jgi:leucyl aminopeptidase
MIHFVLSSAEKGSSASERKRKRSEAPECVVTLFTKSPDSDDIEGYAELLTDVVSGAGLKSLGGKVHDWWKSKSLELEVASLDPAYCCLYFVKIVGKADSSSTVRSFLRLGVSITRLCRRLGLKTVRLEVVGRLGQREMLAIIEGAQLEDYEFLKYKGQQETSAVLPGTAQDSGTKKRQTAAKKSEARNSDLEIEYIDRAGHYLEKAAISAVTARMKQLLAAVAGVHIARDLINTPPTDCSPSHIVKICKDLFKNTSVSVEVLDRKKLKKIGASSILAVGSGSPDGSYLVKLELASGGSRKRGERIALVGKGVTYDSGGLSLKPADSLEWMKFDMAGAATVIGVMHALGQVDNRTLQSQVTAYIPVVENLVDGHSYKPGDVIRTYSGKTVEVLNTDAEGRLILADALSIAQKEGATTVIDVATLTGACVVALGSRVAGLFTRSDELASRIKACGDECGEDFWQLPLHDDYKELLKSNTADLKNISGGKWGGAITAALFLEEFILTHKWVHLDIAGPAFADKQNVDTSFGGVGFGVRTLLRFVSGID